MRVNPASEVAEIRPFTPRASRPAYDDIPDDGAPPFGEAADPRARIKPSSFVWRDPRAIPPRRWLYGRHFVRGYVTATVSPGGVGKSSLLIVELVCMATGRDLLGQKVKRPLTVWYYNLEDPLDEIERRVAAVCLHYGVQPNELDGRLFINSGRDVGVVIARSRGDRVEVDREAVAEIETGIRDLGIDLMVVDPFVSSHAVSENDNGAVDAVAKTWARIADRTSCGVELIHHTRKQGAGQTAEYTVDDARGAGALIGAVRSARVLNPMSKEDAEKAGVPVEERRSYFRVDDGKANMQPPMEVATWRKLVSVDLDNADSDDPSDRVGVVTAWEMPGVLDQVTAEHMEEVRRRAGAGTFRESVQSPEWIGRVVGQVVGIDHDTESGRRQIKSILKVWFRSGALTTKLMKDAGRRERPCVVPGDFNGDVG